MNKTVLITGGAGFIGSHLADELLRNGYRVRVLDNLCEQVHGPGQLRPEYLDPDIELRVGDVCDHQAVVSALHGVDAVFHLAARVGVGQSMYKIVDYTQANMTGTAVLLEALRKRPVRKLIVASSMSIYGEGQYRGADGQDLEAERTEWQLRRGEWEPRGADGRLLTPIATPENKRPALASVYALSKLQQEQMCLIWGRCYDVPAVALRFFNAYGERQALSNPYTGVLAIFAARILNGNPPLVFEDGLQRRDFVHVKDVARACRLALEQPLAEGLAINVGSGQSVSVRDIAALASEVMEQPIAPVITRQYRKGDIRHCFADIRLADRILDFRPQISLRQGMKSLAQWLRTQAAVDRVEQASQELRMRGLLEGVAIP